MNGNSVFVDTNVFVYNRDATDPNKQQKASEWLVYLWHSKAGKTSCQVLEEFYNTVTAKLKNRLPIDEARREAEDLFSWAPIPVNEEVIKEAWLLQDRYRLSWWDSLIVAAARLLDCSYLLSEDLQHRQNFDGVIVVNPFMLSPKDLSLE
jgi:predicted nucleic acid-binding protein